MIHFLHRFDPHQIKLLIFDLDGTLIDSRLDLIHSVNAMLRNFGRPELPGDVVASYVGDGAPMLVRRALGDPKDETLFTQGLEYFLAYYREHKLDHTKVYAGIPEALAAIHASGNGSQRKMAVLSNKPVNPSRAIVEALGLGRVLRQRIWRQQLSHQEARTRRGQTDFAGSRGRSQERGDDRRFIHRHCHRPKRRALDRRRHLRLRSALAENRPSRRGGR